MDDNKKGLQSKKTNFKEYLNFIKSKKDLCLKFFLFSLIFLILPTQNFYTQIQIPKGEPVVRSIDIELPQISLYPVNKTGKKTPALSAISILVIDVESKAIIYAKNPDYKLLPASTTKIMTALVAMDQWQLNDVLQVNTILQVGQTMGLKFQEKISVEDLLYGLLVQSGNDAAYTLADNYPGGRQEFINKMNKKALSLKLLNTHFTNPSGIEASNHFTTVHDLAILSSEALKNEVFAKMVAIAQITVSDVNNEIEHELSNINKLVGQVLGVKGVKTGWTENAGECLVSYIDRDNKKIITVVLKSQDRFGETIKLIDWVYENFSWEAIESIQN